MAAFVESNAVKQSILPRQNTRSRHFCAIENRAFLDAIIFIDLGASNPERAGSWAAWAYGSQPLVLHAFNAKPPIETNSLELTTKQFFGCLLLKLTLAMSD